MTSPGRLLLLAAVAAVAMGSVLAGSGRAWGQEQRVYQLRFSAVPNAVLWVLSTRINGGSWRDQEIGAVRIPGSSDLSALAVVELAAGQVPEFRVEAIVHGGEPSQPSNIVALQALPMRCDLTGDGRVTSLDAARILQASVGTRGTCP